MAGEACDIRSVKADRSPIGFVNAAFELKKQLIDLNIPEPDIIYVTLGSCGTAAGLIIGAAAAGLKSKIIPVRISSTPEEKVKNLVYLINKTVIYLNSLDNSFPKNFATLSGTQIKYPGIDVEINHNFVGNGYADITYDASNAVVKFHRLIGKVFEGTYTGKTLAALISDTEKNILKDKSVLFWNTFSHEIFAFNNAMFAKSENFVNLPKDLQHYLYDKLQNIENNMLEELTYNY